MSVDAHQRCSSRRTLLYVSPSQTPSCSYTCVMKGSRCREEASLRGVERGEELSCWDALWVHQALSECGGEKLTSLSHSHTHPGSHGTHLDRIAAHHPPCPGIASRAGPDNEAHYVGRPPMACSSARSWTWQCCPAARRTAAQASHWPSLLDRHRIRRFYRSCSKSTAWSERRVSCVRQVYRVTVYYVLIDLRAALQGPSAVRSSAVLICLPTCEPSTIDTCWKSCRGRHVARRLSICGRHPSASIKTPFNAGVRSMQLGHRLIPFPAARRPICSSI